jgi:hypothetical protein
MRTILLILFIAVQVHGQMDTCDGIFIYASQSELEWDRQRLLECKVLDNNVFLDGDLGLGRRGPYNSFDALSNIHSIEGALVFTNLIAENEFKGFNNLEVIKRGLVQFNVTSSEMSGFNKLSIINGSLDVSESAFDSLSDLRKVRGELDALIIHLNPNLVSLDGLQGFVADSMIGIGISISSNPRLQSLTGVENLFIGEFGVVEILGNPNLSDCAEKNICEAIRNGRLIRVANNARGCNSEEEIRLECLTSTGEPGQPRFTLYPNPARDKVRLIGEYESMKVLVTDLAGKVWMNEVIKARSIDIGNLPKGSYTISLVTPDGVESQLLMKD